MKRFLLSIFAIVAALVLLPGCRTDYSKSAVERAREYALNNLKGLSDNHRNFIRYTQPVIYENIVYPRYVIPLDRGAKHVEIDDVRHFPVAPEHDLMHSCVVWNPPDLGARVVVAGVVDDCCVLSTVFELIDAGVYTVYLTDATSGLTKEKAAATRLTLEGLSPLHVKLMTTEEYIMEGCPDQAQR